MDGPAIDELGEDIGQIGLRVDAVKLGGLDQRCEAGPVDGTVVVAGEQAIFSIQRDRAHRSLDTVGIHLDVTVVEETYEAVPVVEAIADRLRDGALLRDGGQSGLEPTLSFSTSGFVSTCRTA